MIARPRSLPPFPQSLIRCLLAALLVAVWLPGCTMLQPPDLETHGAVLTELSDDAAVFNFRVAMNNPNDDSLQLLEMIYELRIDGEPVYEGRRAVQRTLGPRTEAAMELPAVIPFTRVGWTEASRPDSVRYDLRGRLQYVTPGYIAEILFDTGVRRPRVSFSSTGDVPLQP